MKKVKFAGKLSLNKETITKLNDAQMGGIIGGKTASQKSYCCGYTYTDWCGAISGLLSCNGTTANPN